MTSKGRLTKKEIKYTKSSVGFLSGRNLIELFLESAVGVWSRSRRDDRRWRPYIQRSPKEVLTKLDRISWSQKVVNLCRSLRDLVATYR